MKGRLLLIFVMFCAIPVIAQNMKSVFIAMPDSLTPLLTQVNKEDCVDFLDSNMKAEVTTRFGGTAEMKALTDDYVFMQTSSSSSLEMRLLPVNDSTKIVCMVKTVCASACDSEIRFYTSDWKKGMDVREFVQCPEADLFYLSGDSVTEESVPVRKKVEMHLVKISLAKDDTSLTFIYTTPDDLNKEDKERLLPYLRKEPIVMQWKDGKFR